MLLIGNGRLITKDNKQPYIEDGCVLIKDTIIADIGKTSVMRAKYMDAEFIDARGRVIMPGLVNTHMHLYSTFARGMALKNASPENFVEILERLWWRLDKVLTLEDVYYSAMVPLIELIKNGTTTIFDHHASPNAIRESLFKIAKATSKSGIRACLCYEVSDRDGMSVRDEGIEENREFITYCNQKGDSMLKGMFGLHASFTLSDNTLVKCRETIEGLNTGFHVHVAEGLADVENSQRQFNKRVVNRLNEFGILGGKTIAAHCVHVDNQEIQLLKESHTNVVHNPASNMGNAVGCAPILEMFKKEVCVGLGTDGYTCDMFESLKVANILHKHQQQNPSVGWLEAPAMLFQENSLIAAKHFDRPLGKLVTGAYGDVIIVDYDPPTPIRPENINSHILFGMSGKSVDTTIVNGKVLMLEGNLIGIDEKMIMAKSRELAIKVWERF